MLQGWKMWQMALILWHEGDLVVLYKYHMQVVQGCLELGNFYMHYRYVFWFMVYGGPFAIVMLIVMLDYIVSLQCVTLEVFFPPFLVA